MDCAFKTRLYWPLKLGRCWRVGFHWLVGNPTNMSEAYWHLYSQTSVERNWSPNSSSCHEILPVFMLLFYSHVVWLVVKISQLIWNILGWRSMSDRRTLCMCRRQWQHLIRTLIKEEKLITSASMRAPVSHFAASPNSVGRPQHSGEINVINMMSRQSQDFHIKTRAVYLWTVCVSYTGAGPLKNALQKF